MFDLELNKYKSFSPLEVVSRGSEIQLQVGKNLHQITWPEKVELDLHFEYLKSIELLRFQYLQYIYEVIIRKCLSVAKVI